MPTIVGAVLGWFTARGLELPADAEAQLTGFLMWLATAVYYVAVRLAETYLSPKFGWLLGLAKQPSYEPTLEPEVTIEFGTSSEQL